jgi:hypothetical protein
MLKTVIILTGMSDEYDDYVRRYLTVRVREKFGINERPDHERLFLARYDRGRAQYRARPGHRRQRVA